jgi:hypothetical protein
MHSSILVACDPRRVRACYNASVRIPRDERPTPWLNRRDQYRMLAMVGLLCLVMMAIQLAALPSSWYWLLPPEPAAATAEPSAPQVPLEELDFRVKQEPHERLPPDVFRAVADDVPADSSVDADADQAADESPPTPISGDDETAAAPVTDDPTIPPEILSGIEDNTVGVRRAELDAYHQMLTKVRELPYEERRKHALGDVAFTVIMLQPEDYRGRLVGITGQLHRLSEYPVMKNDAGIDRLYEGWVFTEESGNNPWRFVCTSLPEGLHLASLSLPRRVRVEGYFFKRMGYASEGGQHVAPTLLARSFELFAVPVGNAPQIQSQMRSWMLAAIGVMIVVLGATFWWFAVSDRRYAKSRLHELAVSRLDADPQALELLKEVNLPDPSRPFAEHSEGDA